MITVHRQGFTDAQNRMIDEAVALGNKVRASLDFVSGIAAMKEPRLMTHLVQSEFLKLDLEFYRPWNPFTSAVAHAQDGVIYLNKRAFNLGIDGLCACLFHETCHLAPLNYKHASNRPIIQDVPRKVGALVLEVARRLA